MPMLLRRIVVMSAVIFLFASLASAATLEWSTYLGGASYEEPNGIAFDADGNVYICGSTASTGWVVEGGDTTYGGGSPRYGDAFVAKLDPSGAFVWATYLGGAGDDVAFNLAVDAAKNVYVVGGTFSDGWTSGGYDTAYGGGAVDPFTYRGGDGFVAKLDPAGTVAWSTYVGGSSNDWAVGLGLDSDLNIYVSGSTKSSGWTSGGADTSYGTAFATGYLAKLTNAGAHVWSTYVGGGIANDYGQQLALDAAGANIYVVGETNGAGWTVGGYDTSYGGGSGFGDAFLSKYSSAGAFVWSTYLGGNDQDYGYGVVVDSAGNAIATGSTASADWITSGSLATYGGGQSDAFAAKVSPSGALLWGAYLGGSSTDGSFGVALADAGGVYVTGTTYSDGWVSGGFKNAAQAPDGYVLKLSASGSHLWSSYVGGSESEMAYAIGSDANGALGITGTTYSAGWVAGGYDTTNGGGGDGFAVKILDPRSAAGQRAWLMYR